MTGAAKPAPWNVMEPDKRDKKYLMVHNCFTERTFRLRKKDVGAPLGHGARGKWLDFLIAEKLIVDPARVNPLLEERLFEIMRGCPEGKADAVLTPTYECQLNCEYCFNVNVRKPEGKKRATPEAIASKMVKFFTGTPAQIWRLKVTGGGEPLLALGYALKIAGLVRRAAKDHGRFFEMRMVTNGAAMTAARAEKLAKAGLNMVQITLDPHHDRKRAYKNGRGSLADVLKNIETIPQSVMISVISNLDVGDEEAFGKLVDMLKPLRGRIWDFIPGPVTAKIPATLASDGKKKISRYIGPKEADTMLACFDAVEKAGFRRDQKFPRVICESFVEAEHFFINYYGQTSICPGLEATPEYQERGRGSGALKKLFDMRLTNPQWRDHCYEKGTPCPYLSKCWGGCRMVSVIQGAGWETINCEKYMFDRLTRHLLSCL